MPTPDGRRQASRGHASRARARRLRLHRHERGGLRLASEDHGVANVVDVSELLVDPIAVRAERHPLALRVAFQDSCHLKHAQRVEAEPRAALGAIPGLRCSSPASRRSAAAARASTTSCSRRRRASSAGARPTTCSQPPRTPMPAAIPAACSRSRRRSVAPGRPLPAFHPIELVDASIRAVNRPSCWRRRGASCARKPRARRRRRRRGRSPRRPATARSGPGGGRSRRRR